MSRAVQRRQPSRADGAARDALAAAATVASAAGVAARARRSGRRSRSRSMRLKAEARRWPRRPYRAPTSPPPALVRAIDYDAFGKIAYRPAGDALGRRSRRPRRALLPARPAMRRRRSRCTWSPAARRGRCSIRPRCSTSPADSPLRTLGDAGGFAGFRVHERRRIAPTGSPTSARPISARPTRSTSTASRPAASPSTRRAPAPRSSRSSPPSGWSRRRASELVVLRPAGRTQRRRRLSASATGARPPGWCRTSRPSCTSASAWRTLGIAPLTSMYWYGQHRPRAGRRLAPADPRQRRAGDLDRRRRAHLAPARRSAAGEGQRLRGQRARTASA